MTNEEAARKIIEENVYITISTVSHDGEPWISPVYFCYDELYNFYWNSNRDRKHSQNIENDKRIAFVIFDTHHEGRGRGVYVQARAHEIDDQEELKKIISIFYTRKNKPARDLEEFVGSSKRRMYKAVPEKIWVTDEKSDDRIEVSL